jgi:hypothetical protein
MNCAFSLSVKAFGALLPASAGADDRKASRQPVTFCRCRVDEDSAVNRVRMRCGVHHQSGCGVGDLEGDRGSVGREDAPGVAIAAGTVQLAGGEDEFEEGSASHGVVEGTCA